MNESTNVTTCVVVWIEILVVIPQTGQILVTTCVVVWIEICIAEVPVI